MFKAVSATAVVIAALAALSGASGATSTRVRYYLSLGDSLSQGQQPDLHGVTRNTAEGYSDQLFAILRRRIPGLRLVKLGCGGESTSSMITGHGNERAARLNHCHPAGGSQLKAAVRFLRAHHAAGEVPVLTIDIGANDVDGCIDVPRSQLGACLAKGEAEIKHDLPIILRTLRRAAPRRTALAGMTLYDPALDLYFNSSSRALALASPALAEQVNDLIESADKRTKFKTADVAGAFHTYDTKDTVGYKGQQVPVDVAACAPGPGPARRRRGVRTSMRTCVVTR